MKAIVHSGKKLLLWSNFPNHQETEDMLLLYELMKEEKSRPFVYNNKLYINDGNKYIYYNGTEIKEVKEDAFTPTTTIGRSPTGGGTLYQPVNLLQAKRKNSFLGNGTLKEFTLDTAGLDNTPVTAVVNGVTITEGNGLTVSRATGQITFTTAPAKPATEGQDNVIITFAKTIEDYITRIEKCLLTCIFDNRVFFSGNPNYPNTLFHSMLNDPTYISDLAYYQDGSDNVPITTLERVGSSLVVIKYDDQQDAVVYYHEPKVITVNNIEDTLYPTRQGSAGIGNISMWGAKNYLDELVFISRLGLEHLSKLNLGLERNLEHKSTLVDGKLVNEKDLSNIHLEQWRGYLFCLINGRIYIADNRQKYVNNGTKLLEYEWYFWDKIGDVKDGIFYKATLLKEYDGDLYFGTENGVVAKFEDGKRNDNGRIIYSQWQLPDDFFKAENRRKTTSKRGGVALLKTIQNSICKLKTKTDNNKEKEITRFVASGFSYENFIYNDFTYQYGDKLFMKYKIKEKKLTQISMTFYSDELDRPFGLINVILEAFVGGYIKAKN